MAKPQIELELVVRVDGEEGRVSIDADRLEADCPVRRWAEQMADAIKGLDRSP